MHRNLIIKAFEKARNDIRSTKLTHSANHLSDYIFEESGEQYGEKSLRTHYNMAKENSADNIEFKEYVKQSLSKFLGYENYQHFLKENSASEEKNDNNEKSKNAVKIFIQKNRVVILVSTIVILGVFIINSFNQPKWMVWQEGHYIEVPFNLKKYDISQLKIYKTEWIHDFKQIIPGCGVTKYFKHDGSPNLWYGKSSAGNLEFFTHYGLHPETGKTLKPITDYMIAKHICK